MASSLHPFNLGDRTTLIAPTKFLKNKKLHFWEQRPLFALSFPCLFNIFQYLNVLFRTEGHVLFNWGFIAVYRNNRVFIVIVEFTFLYLLTVNPYLFAFSTVLNV